MAQTLTDVDGTLVSSGTTKTSKVRSVPISSFIAEEIAPLLSGKSPDNYVFTFPEAGRYATRTSTTDTSAPRSKGRAARWSSIPRSKGTCTPGSS